MYFLNKKRSFLCGNDSLICPYFTKFSKSFIEESHFEFLKRCAYSHLSNKREVTLTDFEKFHPPQKKIWKKSKIRPRFERTKKDRNICKCLEMS